MTPLQADVLSG